MGVVVYPVRTAPGSFAELPGALFYSRTTPHQHNSTPLQRERKGNEEGNE
jgi:hypothetical protein